MATVYMETNRQEIERIQREFAATQKQVNRAGWRAVRKLARWVRSTALRETARDTGIKRKVLSHRLILYTRGGHQSARVWFGMNALPLSALDPRQTATGVTAGPAERRHAFIVPRGGTTQVYRRVHRDERLPLAVQYHAIEDEMQRVLQADISPRFARMFSKYFEQELRWEVSKAR